MHDARRGLTHDVTSVDEHLQLMVRLSVIRRCAAKISDLASQEFGDVETAQDSVARRCQMSADVDTDMRLTGVQNPEVHSHAQNASVRQQCCDSDNFPNLGSAGECDGLHTDSSLSVPLVSEVVEIVHGSNGNRNLTDGEIDGMNDRSEKTAANYTLLGDSPTCSIIGIAEPCDADQTTTLSAEQPPIIKLSRTEDPFQPDSLQTSDTNSSGGHVTCPRIIPLERKCGNESSVLQSCAISDPSEPSDTDAEPVDDDVRAGLIPREIKLDREELRPCGSLDKPHGHDGFHTSLVAETHPGEVHRSSQDRTADRTTYHRNGTSLLSSAKTTSNSGCDDRPSSEHPVPKFSALEDCNYNNGESNVEKSSSLSCIVESDRCVSNHRYLSDGEIVGEEDEEEFGVFQVPKCAYSNQLKEYHSKRSKRHKKKAGNEKSQDDSGDDEDKEDYGEFQNRCASNHRDVPQCAYSSKPKKHDRERHKKKGGNLKRSREDYDGDLAGLQRRSKTEDGLHRSRSDNPQKVSKNARSRSTTSRSSSTGERRDETTHHLVYKVAKKTSQLQRRRKHKITKKYEGERSSVSSEKLVVIGNHTSRRKVVVIKRPKPDDKLRETSTHKSTPISVRESPCDMRESERRTSHKRKHHHQRHRTHRSESQAHKHKRKHKKHAGKHCRSNHRSDAGDGADVSAVVRRSRSKASVVEATRSVEQRAQSSDVHQRLPSVVVHKNTVIRARQWSSSDSSSDSRSAPTTVSQKPDRNRSGHASSGDTHLSRLTYAGVAEEDESNTPPGDCIESEYGPKYDANWIFRHLAYLRSRVADDVGTVGVSYSAEKRSRSNSVHNADSSAQDDDGDNKPEKVAISPDRQPYPSVRKDAATVQESVTADHRPTNRTATDRTETRKVTLVAKKVQTQEPLFAVIRDHHVTESSILSQCTKLNPGHGKADKELQMPDFDNKQKSVPCPSFPADVCCNITMLPEAVTTGTQSGENRIKQCSRAVQTNRADTQHHTTPNLRDFSDPHSCKALPVTTNILSQQVDKSVDAIRPPITTSRLEDGSEQLKCSSAAADAENSTEVSSTSTARSSDAADTSTNIVSDVAAGQLPVDGVACNKERSHSSDVGYTAPAAHQMPRVVAASSFRRRRRLSSENLTATSSVVGGSAGSVPPGTSTAVQRWRSKPVSAVTTIVPSATDESVSRDASVGGRVDSAIGAVTGGVTSAPSLHHQAQPGENRNNSNSPTFTKVYRIPGIDVEPGTSRGESIRGRPASLSSACRSTLSDGRSLQQTSAGRLAVRDVVTTSAATTVAASGIQQRQTVDDSVPVTLSGVETRSHSTSRPQSSSQVTVSSSHITLHPTSDDDDVIERQRPAGAPVFPLLSTIATCMRRPATGSDWLAGTDGDVTTSSSGVSSADALNSTSCSTAIASTRREAVTAWLTGSHPGAQTPSRPLSTPSPLTDPHADSSSSPSSDEDSCSFSPPSHEHMMLIIKMKHTLGLNNKSSRRTTDRSSVKQPTKTKMTVSLKYKKHSLCSL